MFVAYLYKLAIQMTGLPNPWSLGQQYKLEFKSLNRGSCSRKGLISEIKKLAVISLAYLTIIPPESLVHP
jgi:hypothetical protein